MGDLGDQEILLLAYDDGDVIAYYTSRIERLLSRHETHEPRDSISPLKPFFHENAEISAWGLAIHKQSRLIAVGTNKHEVHVFAFGLVDPPRPLDEDSAELPDTSELFLRLEKDHKGFVLSNSEALMRELEEYGIKCKKNPLLLHRERSYRIILMTEYLGDNIPSVAFRNDAAGEAEKIVAIDIRGTLWTMDIWSLDYHAHRLTGGLHQKYMEWKRSQSNYLIPLE